MQQIEELVDIWIAQKDSVILESDALLVTDAYGASLLITDTAAARFIAARSSIALPDRPPVLSA